ncbi:hypothetical protein [Pseudoalteromonas spongiae]|uniref:hypothetical protein n=1 Tax=Pseudoalteromonas spongiae TaxID=298657 RepID=UPI00110C18CA|nr:hypothetical protein [Pseudoalteromonas spongiae]TMO82537.1 hypothetical protein CWC15_19015 [Pseudoalteromonas spongiae]
MKYFIAPVLLGATTLYFANMAYQQSLTISGLSNELISQEETAFMQEQQLIELRKKLASVTTVDSKIAALQFEIERLNKRLANDTNADTQPTTSHSELANFENSPPEQSGLTEFANKVATQQSSEEPIDFVADALNLFENEEIDYAWATETEQNIAQLFADRQEFSDVTLVNSSCKSTHCKITVQPNQQHTLMIGMNFARLLDEQTWSKNSSAMFTYVTNESGEMTLIYKRDGLL